jgi:hypothetical protein
VLADRCLRGGGEDRFGQLRALDEPRRQRHAGDRAVLLVLLETETGEVAAGDALDGQHLQLAAPDRAPGELRGHVRRRDDVVGHLGELLEPPQRELGEQRALVRDPGRQDDVVDRQPVRRDQDQVVAVLVDVADLAGVQQLHRVAPGV